MKNVFYCSYDEYLFSYLNILECSLRTKDAIEMFEGIDCYQSVYDSHGAGLLMQRMFIRSGDWLRSVAKQSRFVRLQWLISYNNLPELCHNSLPPTGSSIIKVPNKSWNKENSLDLRVRRSCILTRVHVVFNITVASPRLRMRDVRSWA